MSASTSNLAAQVVRWQKQHGRHDLPWQQTRDPYRVWLSEVMLQQTQVSTVLGYYDRFLQRFPTVQDLAQAPLDEVLALWSGLGYYSRARHLHACAQTVVTHHAGQFPKDPATLATLPGIGRSTAAAIAAFCFGARAAILDGNVKRVLTRVLGFGEDLSQARHEKALWSLAESLLPQRDIDRYTQGLMDLGAQVCTARQPRCGLCPLRSDCVAHAQERPHDFPVKTKRTRRGRRVSVLWWLQHRDEVWLVQRPAPGVWAGLWCLPERPVQDPQELGIPPAATPSLGAWADAVKREQLSPIEHALTHFDWLLLPVRFTLPSKFSLARRQHMQLAFEADLAADLAADHVVAEGAPKPGQWCTVGEALALGLPAPVRKLLESA